MQESRLQDTILAGQIHYQTHWLPLELLEVAIWVVLVASAIQLSRKLLLLGEDLGNLR
jgi:hypothetical protein